MDARITELLEELKQAIDKAATTGDKFQVNKIAARWPAKAVAQLSFSQ